MAPLFGRLKPENVSTVLYVTRCCGYCLAKNAVRVRREQQVQRHARQLLGRGDNKAGIFG